MRSKLYRVLVTLALMGHNFFYKLAAKFAIKLEQGVHPKHRLLSYHEFFLKNIQSTDRVLDIGCGNGILTFDIAKKAKEVVGIDLSPKNIKVAREKYSNSNIKYLIGNANDCDFGQRFDVVILSNVLEHIEDRARILEKIKNLSSKLLVRVPMKSRDWITLYKEELGIEYRLDKTHCVEYTLGIFKKELADVCLDIATYSVQFGEIWAVVKIRERGAILEKRVENITQNDLSIR